MSGGFYYIRLTLELFIERGRERERLKNKQETGNVWEKNCGSTDTGKKKEERKANVQTKQIRIVFRGFSRDPYQVSTIYHNVNRH